MGHVSWFLCSALANTGSWGCPRKMGDKWPSSSSENPRVRLHFHYKLCLIQSWLRMLFISALSTLLSVFLTIAFRYINFAWFCLDYYALSAFLSIFFKAMHGNCQVHSWLQCSLVLYIITQIGIETECDFLFLMLQSTWYLFTSFGHILYLSNDSLLFLPCSINETIFEETATAMSFKEIRRRDP